MALAARTVTRLGGSHSTVTRSNPEEAPRADPHAGCCGNRGEKSHMRQLKRCFSYVTHSQGLTLRDQAVDPIRQGLQWAAARPFLDHRQASGPAIQVPMPHAADGGRQFLAQQFPHPPRGRAARAVQTIPTVPAPPPGPLLQHPGIEQLAVEIEIGQRATLTGAELVDIR